MLEDKWLLYRLQQGHPEALQRIYEKYKDELLALALTLSYDKTAAEDILHEVIVSFTEHAPELTLRTNLKCYLSAGIANRVRNLQRLKLKTNESLAIIDTMDWERATPIRLAMRTEFYEQVNQALQQVPYDQKEIIILHLYSGMRFRAIAQALGLSINTVQSRYRYGLDKLRQHLKGTVDR